METSALQHQLGAIADNLSKGDKAKAHKAAEQFEAVFLSQMLNTMSEGIKTDGPFGGGQEEKMYRGMLNDQYASAISKRGGVGIADQVYKEILKLQETQAEAKKEDQALGLAPAQTAAQKSAASTHVPSAHKSEVPLPPDVAALQEGK